MQVSIESLEGLQRKMTVQVPADQITTAFDQKIKQLSKTVKLDGFRPGKVPVSVVKQKYGAQIRSEVMGDLIESSYRDALIQEKIRPASMPEIKPVEGADTEDMTYDAIFEVYPEIESVELDSIEVEKPVAEIKDEDLDNMIKKLLEQRKEWIEVERAADEGDQVTADFDGSIDGEAFEGGAGKDMAIEIGAGRMLKEFEEGLKGMSKGEEKTIDVTFPEDYHGKDVAGKTAQFKLNVTKVSEAKIPELNEELVKSFGVENGDIEAFKKDVSQNMHKELAQKVKTSVKNAVMTALLSKNDVAAPKALVDDEINNLKQQMAQNMGQDPSKMDLNSFPNELFEEEGSRRVKLGLLVGELIRIEGIKLSQDRFNETLQEMAETYEEPQQVVDYYTKNQNARASLEGMVLEDQVVDHILEKATVTEKVFGFEEMMNGPAPK
jgi:trigger factor